MRILFWNILHGGGASRLPEVLLSILEKKADVVALCEFRAVRGGQLRAVLADHGLEHQAVSHRAGRANGMLVASRVAMRVLETPPEYHSREIDVEFEACGLHMTALHVADDAHPTLKTGHWNRLISLARERRDGKPHLILGDLNTARREDTGDELLCSQRLGMLATFGYEDLWQAENAGIRAATWVSPWGEGRRIDAAWGNAALRPHVAIAAHDDVARELRHSDHAALIVELTGLNCGKL
jgi:exonuclease III